MSKAAIAPPQDPTGHWSKQAPDGLCQLVETDPKTGTVVRNYRGPWPGGGTCSNHKGQSTLPTSRFHKHDSDCLVPVREVVPVRNVGSTGPVYDTDGGCRFEGFETAEGCKTLRIPVFRRVAA